MTTNADVNDKYNVQELESILRQKCNGGNTLKVLHLSINNLVGIGENFAGSLYAINAKVQRNSDSSATEELYLVGKGILKDDSMTDWTIMINKEAFMYTDIVPSYVALEKENNFEDRANIEHNFPRFWGFRLSLDPKKITADEHAIILMENVKARGYYVLDKKIGLDFEHAAEALSVLARFHAAGLALKINNPSRFAKFVEIADLSGYQYYENQIVDWFHSFIDAVKALPSGHKYIKRVEKIVKRRLKQIFSYVEVRHDSWSTIIHNDFWTNNMMFRKNESTGKIEGLKIIDFQLFAHADVAIDLYYFMLTSLERSVMFDRFDDLLHVYLESLVGELESLKVDVGDRYTKEKLDELLKEDAWSELFHCAFALSFFTVEMGDAGPEEYFEKIFHFRGGDILTKKLEDLLEIYDRRGWLD